jgi:excisionase family DNA binding protein
MQTPTETQPVRVSISEAARLFGVHPQTIRRAIQANEVRYIVVCGRYKISFESLVAWSEQKTRVKQKRNTRGIGQFVSTWNISNTLYSPRTPEHPTESES